MSNCRRTRPRKICSGLSQICCNSLTWVECCGSAAVQAATATRLPMKRNRPTPPRPDRVIPPRSPPRRGGITNLPCLVTCGHLPVGCIVRGDDPPDPPMRPAAAKRSMFHHPQIGPRARTQTRPCLASRRRHHCLAGPSPALRFTPHEQPTGVPRAPPLLHRHGRLRHTHVSQRIIQIRRTTATRRHRHPTAPAVHAGCTDSRRPTGPLYLGASPTPVGPSCCGGGRGLVAGKTRV